MEKANIQSPILRFIQSYHKGNGPLRGGGATIMKNHSANLKKCKGKLDKRLGYCIIACTITIATILIVFSTIHQYGSDKISTYIVDTHDMIADSLNNAKPECGGNEKEENNATSVTNDELISSVETLNESDCLDPKFNDRSICLSTEELNDDYNSFKKVNIALWSLAALNIIIAGLIFGLNCCFESDTFEDGVYKKLNRFALCMALFLLLCQFIFFITPLFVNTRRFIPIVDKLFMEKQPRYENGMHTLESEFACHFNTVEKLVEMNLETPCLSAIKNSLLPLSCVVLLIIIDLIPFVFLIFTYAWDACIKESKTVSSLRRRIELNNQRRVRTRDDILRKAMNADDYS